MSNRFTRHIPLLLAVVCWYVIIPVQIVLAASKELNLDLEDPQVAPVPSMFGLLLRLVVSLGIISGIAYVIMKFMRKNLKVMSGGTSITVLDQYAFSVNKGIFITQIAGKVYVLGVTDNNITLITEISDRHIIEELEQQAKDREKEPILPVGILERFLPQNMGQPVSGKNSFNEHIQKQIKKLQSVIERNGASSQEDDRNG